MQYPDAANTEELDKFLGSNPDTNMMEVLMMDLNGIPRGKSISRREFSTLFTSGLKSPASTALMNTEGDVDDDLGVDCEMGAVTGDVNALLQLTKWQQSTAIVVMDGRGMVCCVIAY